MSLLWDPVELHGMVSLLWCWRWIIITSPIHVVYFGTKLFSAWVVLTSEKLALTFVATAHPPGASASVNSSATHLSINQTPASQNKTLSSSSGSGTPTKDGPNILLTCPVCKRQVCGGSYLNIFSPLSLLSLLPTGVLLTWRHAWGYPPAPEEVHEMLRLSEWLDLRYWRQNWRSE